MSNLSYSTNRRGLVNAPVKAMIALHTSQPARSLVRHPWAIGLMASRTAPGVATLRHHDAVLGCFRAGRFSVSATAHAYSLLDSYVYGFALQRINLPFNTADEAAPVAQSVTEQMPTSEMRTSRR